MKPASPYTGEQPHFTIPACTSTAPHIPTKPSHAKAISNSSAKTSKAVPDPVTASPQRGSVPSPSHHSLCRARGSSVDWHQDVSPAWKPRRWKSSLKQCRIPAAPAQLLREEPHGTCARVQEVRAGQLRAAQGRLWSTAEPSGTDCPAVGSGSHINFAVESRDSWGLKELISTAQL